jgi:hypothetical protein
MNKQVVALLVLITIGWAACPANYNINNLQAGKASPIPRFHHLRSQQQCLPKHAKLQVSVRQLLRQRPRPRPRYAPPHAALNDFALNYVGAQSFAVFPASVGTDTVNFQFDFSSAVWSRVRVNFWASSNPEIQLGNFRVGTPSATQTPSPPTPSATAASSTPTPSPPSQNLPIPSSASSSTASTALPMFFRSQSVPPILRALRSPPESRWAPRLPFAGLG